MRAPGRVGQNHDHARPSGFGTEYRRDLQGIRAIAVLLVLLYHAGLPWVPGGFVGVDIFFVLSGFLITGIVAREVSETGGLSLARFYGRRVLRIIPAATVVLVVVAMATVLWLPITRWQSTALETIGSAFYVSNWQFAATTDYLNASLPPSALQHFWSLAIEEQYYLLWPALLALGCLMIRRRFGTEPGNRRMLRCAWWLMVSITVLSFAFSLLAMIKWPDAAYFLTPTRLWELGIGSLLALAAPQLRGLPYAASQALVLGGILAVLAAGLGYTQATPFPGATALLPTLGTAAMIAGGLGPRPASVGSVLLGNRGMVWVGNISYALYLWHWPVLIVARQGFGLTGLRSGILLAALSVVPAYLSTRYLEKPLTRSRVLRNSPLRAFRIAIIALLCSLLAAASVFGALFWNVQPAQNFDPSTAGAATLSDGRQPPAVTRIPRNLTPSLIDAKNDIPAVYADGCHLEVAETTPKPCTYGDPRGTTVLLVGDSHAAQWFSALEEIATSRGYRLVSMTKSSCPFADLTIELTGRNRPYSECADWNRNVRHYIERTRPAVIVTSTLGIYTDAEHPKAEDALELGLRRSWSWAAERGSTVVPLVDTPYMSTNVPECLASHASDPQACSTVRAEAYPHQGLERRAAADLRGVTVIDLNDLICPGTRCEPIIGDVLVYRDQHHLSDTYVRTLMPALLRRGERLLPLSHE